MERGPIQFDPHGLGQFLLDWQRGLTERIAESPFQHSANAGLILRDHVLAARPNELGLSAGFSGSPVWLALIDVADSSNVNTLVVSQRQTALLSVVTGKVIAPALPVDITSDAEALLRAASSALLALHQVPATPLPIAGRTTFYFRVQTVIHGIDIDTAALSNGTDPLSVLYEQALSLIGRIRELR